MDILCIANNCWANITCIFRGDFQTWTSSPAEMTWAKNFCKGGVGEGRVSVRGVVWWWRRGVHSGPRCYLGRMVLWSKLAAPARRKQGKGQWASVAGSTQWRGEGHPSIPREVVGFPKLPESANSSRVLFSHGHLCSGSLPYGQPLGSAQAACSQNRPRLRNCKVSLKWGPFERIVKFRLLTSLAHERRQHRPSFCLECLCPYSPWWSVVLVQVRGARSRGGKACDAK